MQWCWLICVSWFHISSFFNEQSYNFFIILKNRFDKLKIIWNIKTMKFCGNKPNVTAWCNGVSLSLSCALTSAPWSINNFANFFVPAFNTTNNWKESNISLMMCYFSKFEVLQLPLAARCNGVLCSLSATVTSAPLSTSNLTISYKPRHFEFIVFS